MPRATHLRLPGAAVLLLLASALAAPLPEATPGSSLAYGISGTTALPDARARTAGDAELGVGVGLVAQRFVDYCLAPRGSTSGCGGPALELAGGLGVRAAWSPAAGLRLEANVAAVDEPGFVGDVTAAWSGAVSSRVRLGFWAGAGAHTFIDFRELTGFAFAAGGALHAAWPKVALDVNVPFFVADVAGTLSPLLALAGSEVELTFPLRHGHALRTGLFSAAPGFGWLWTGPKWFARAELHTVLVVSGVRAEVGSRF